MSAKSEKTKPLFGNEAKIAELFEKNHVNCVGHDFLLSPQKCACCPKPLTAEAYTFSYQAKVSNDPQKAAPMYFFQTGPNCFDKIAKFGKRIKRPPRINIYELADKHLSSQSSNANASASESIEGFKRVNLEAILAINLIFIVWEQRKPGSLQTYYNEILADPNEEIQNDRVITINNAAHSTINNYNDPPAWTRKKPPAKPADNLREAATDVILMANKTGRNIREYRFPNLTAILREAGEDIFI